MCGIATNSATACFAAAEDKDIPVIFNAITDPVQAKLDSGNITGVSDKLPVEAQLDLIRKCQPDAATIGIIYTTSEPNSVSAIAEYKEKAGEYGFEAVLNDQPDLGLSRSVRLGLERLTDCGGVLFLVADQPWLKRDSVEALAALWAQHPAKIAAMAHGGVRGNPCLFPARFYPELLALNGDRGGSAVIRNHEADLILLEADALELTDIDTPEALKQAGSAG